MAACKKKSYVATDSIKSDDEYFDLASGSDGAMDGAGAGGGGGHGSDVYEGEDAHAGSQARDSRPELFPVEPNLSKNIEDSLKNRVPKGPDCANPDGKGAFCSPLESIKKAVLNFFFRSVYASAKDIAESLKLFPDRTFTQSQLMNLVKSDPEAASDFSRIANIHIFSDSQGSMFNSFDVAVSFRNGAEVWGRGNSNLDESCKLLEKAFPLKRGKDFFEVKEVGGSGKIKLRHPYQGKVCKSQNLEDYRVLNFFTKDVDSSRAATNQVPSLTFLIAKNVQKNPSYIVSSRKNHSSELLYRMQEAMVATRSLNKNSAISPAVKEKRK